MMRTVIGIALAMIAGAAAAQDLSGVRLGDTLTEAGAKLGSSPIQSNESGPFSIRKWKLADQNELSATAIRADGQIVYLETNWSNQQTGAVSDFPGFSYGRTSLDQIRKRLGSNGFAFGDRGAFQTPDGGIAGTNSFDVDGAPDTIVTFITLVPAAEMRRLKNRKVAFGSAAKLDTIILARPAYLEGLWGGARKYDPAYKRIRWIE